MMVEMVGLALYPSALAIATVSQLPVYIAGPIAFGKGFFSILANFYINFETGKLPSHEKNNFIFHVNMHFCNLVLFH
jgi:hypothetical protein